MEISTLHRLACSCLAKAGASPMSIRTIFWIAGSSAEAAGGMTASLLHDADWSGNVYDFYRKA
jgi:hypothetical protein